MLDLIKLGEKTYYVASPVNVGIYLLDNDNVCLIDTGNSKEFAKEIEKIINANNWNLKFIINTHSHADHIGGNKYLQNKYNIKIYANKIESYFINDCILEPSLLYGANPPKEMHIKFIEADSSCCEDIANLKVEGLEVINLEGHSKGMIGVVTSDDVCFVGDAYTSKKILDKYAIQYVFDIENYFNTLNYLKNTNYRFYVPAHGEVEENPTNTINVNIKNIEDIEKNILKIIHNGISYNDLLKEVFNLYHIKINIVQYHLISATIKTFLSKLENDGRIEFLFKKNEMFIKIIESI